MAELTGTLETLFYQNLDAHSLNVIGLAFLGGVVSSVLPCTIAMLPLMIGYIGGYAGNSRKDIFLQTLLFILGVATVMAILGVIAGLFGITFGAWLGPESLYAVGILAVLIGLHLLEVIRIPLPHFITRLPENGSARQTPLSRLLAPFALGAMFGAASSPCGTPFLAGILGFISQEKNLFLGGVSLFTYALGQGVLLLAAGLFTGILKHMATLRRVGFVMNRLSAGVFILAGLAMIAEAAGFLEVLMSSVLRF